ncbi:hypothetical protein ABZ891_24635 [Streptomyces sp. NPDC047023]|uniref:hypothetical protein n=1 Tax=Streptomyces sp. NPDC047023 TaxID=3155139 RepID=UPI003402060A
MKRSAQEMTRLLHLIEEATRIRRVWEEVATTRCCRPAEEVKAAYEAAAERWEVSLDERTVTLSSMWIGRSSYWE